MRYLPGLILAIAFVCIASLWIWLPGIQNDEALFGGAIFKPDGHAGELLSVFQRKFPLMVMTYVGSLKALIYKFVFKVWPPTPTSIRLPAVITGGLSIWFLYLLMQRLADWRAAVATCALLVSDSIYLFTIRFDWGPVAFQHLLLTAALWALVAFYQDRDRGLLALGCFCLGLGMWDKALFGWLLFGIGVGALVACPRELWRSISISCIAIALVSFALGALPLILYNARTDFETFRTNTKWDANWRNKAELIRYTLQGQGINGQILREDVPQGEPARFGRHYIYEGSLAALLLAPLVWRKPAFRIALFAVAAFSAGWLIMATTSGAGEATHHIVLLWPFPHILMGAVFAALSERWMIPAAALVLALVVTNGILMKQYFGMMLRNGGAAAWTEAIYPATPWLEHSEYPKIHVIDWGILNTLRLLGSGRLDLYLGEDYRPPEAFTDNDRRANLDIINDPKTVFFSHTKGNEFFPGKMRWLERMTEAEGYQKHVIRVFYDYQGRAVLEAFRYERPPR